MAVLGSIQKYIQDSIHSRALMSSSPALFQTNCFNCSLLVGWLLYCCVRLGTPQHSTEQRALQYGIQMSNDLTSIRRRVEMQMDKKLKGEK